MRRHNGRIVAVQVLYAIDFNRESIENFDKRFDDIQEQLENDEKYEEMKYNHNIAAYTNINGYHYWSTIDQLYSNDIYIIDPLGLKSLEDLGETISPKPLTSKGLTITLSIKNYTPLALLYFKFHFSFALPSSN